MCARTKDGETLNRDMRRILNRFAASERRQKLTKIRAAVRKFMFEIEMRRRQDIRKWRAQGLITY